MSLLEVDHLRVRFETENGPVLAVKDVSFSLDPGEIVALVGESGCGKSVTAMAIPRLIGAGNRVSIDGDVVMDGINLARVPERRMQAIRGNEISMIFQEPMTSLNPSFTIGFQIAEVIKRHRRLSGRQLRQRVVELLRLVGIPDADRRTSSFPHELSGGMRQRVMIAIAVACDPRILIADEPTTALDVTIQAAILDIIRRLRDEFGTAVIMITHDLGVVAEIADRVVVMYAGRRVEEAAVSKLFAEPQHPYTIGLLGALPARAIRTGDRDRLTEIAGMVPLPIDDPDECQFAARCARATDQCRVARPALEEVRPLHQVACYHPGAANARSGGDRHDQRVGAADERR